MSLHDRLQKAGALTEQAQPQKLLTERMSMGIAREGIYSARDAQYSLEDLATALARLEDRGGYRRRSSKRDDASKSLLKEALDAINAASKTTKKLADNDED